MKLTQKIRIFPTPEQEMVLWKLSEKCRLIYNFALAERRDAYRRGIKGVNYRTQQNDLPLIKEQFPEYKWVYSKVLQYALRSLAADYESFFALRKNGHIEACPPRFKGKNYFTTMVYNQSGFKIEPGTITFSHKYNDTQLEFAIPDKFSFDDKQVKQVVISSYRSQYFVTITYELEEPLYVDNDRYQAIDLGITHLVTAVNSHGKFVMLKNQKNRKGFKPSIRRQRYQLQPYDLVKYNNRMYRVKGVHCYGKRVVLENPKGKNLSIAIKKVKLVKYGKGLLFTLC